METVDISYRITLNKDTTEVFDFTLDGSTFDLLDDTPDNPPEWTRLEYRQCSHCPLDKQEHPHCPVALQLFRVVERFHDTRSIDDVDLEVITEERRVAQTTALQRALASMLGLLFPTCGCPKTAYMKPLARFHLPLASEEETVFHVSGMYLLAQFFVHQKSQKNPFDGLATLYDDMHLLNKAVASRVQTATTSDSLKNAITLLDMYSTLIPMLIEDELVEMRRFFAAYLPDDPGASERKAAMNSYLERAKAFTLELLPIEGEETPDRGSEDVHTRGTKASFALPDDDPVPVAKHREEAGEIAKPAEDEPEDRKKDDDFGGLRLVDYEP